MQEVIANSCVEYLAGNRQQRMLGSKPVGSKPPGDKLQDDSMESPECLHAFGHLFIRFFDTLSTANEDCMLRKYLELYR